MLLESSTFTKDFTQRLLFRHLCISPHQRRSLIMNAVQFFC
nr:MAG TPA: hypothetical protein [Caudoviricetes sp.]